MIESNKIIDKYDTEEYNNINIEKIKRLTRNLGYSLLIVNRLDYYGNTIPLGAFANAVAFILYGFHRCQVFKNKDTFLWGIILLFGGLGQVTAGLLEFIKARSFASMIYLTYGFYCFSHYFLYIMPLQFKNYFIFGINFDESSLCGFYGAWMIISIPLTVASIRTNLFYVLQCLATTAFFVLRCFGEGFLRYSLMRHAAGILEAIAGFVSLYICINQLINEAFRFQLLPAIPLTHDNEIDIAKEKEQ